MWTRERWMVVVVALVVSTAAACGSSSKGTTGSSTTTGITGPCPFSGSTQSQTQAGATSGIQLTKVQTTTAGCIDNAEFQFSPKLGASETAYQTPSVGS